MLGMHGQVFRARILGVREEILRKRRAGKLPPTTTHVLKTWWHSHIQWPYPTVRDLGKKEIVEEVEEGWREKGREKRKGEDLRI